MNGKIKRAGNIFICLLAAVLFLFAFFPTSKKASAVSTDDNYWFEEISTEIVVNENKTYEVTETMKVGFLFSNVNTGIIRDIQRISQTTHVIDGKEKKGANFFTKISDVEVTINGAPAKVTQSLYDNGNFYSIKMQLQGGGYFPATDVDVGGENDFNVFVLKYVYDMSDDKAAGYDDFTFDVLGYAMARTKYFTAKITFPESVEDYDISFRTNYKEPWHPNETLREGYTVEGNTITMSAFPMEAYKGYTVQVILPNGFFKGTGRTFYVYYIAFAAVAAAGIAVGLLLFFKYRKRKPIEQVEFYPPEGMRPMRFSAIYHGRAEQKDVSAVIMKWADEGHVGLERDGNNDLRVIKRKDSSGSVCSEEIAYFNAMFPKESFVDQDVFSTKNARISTTYMARTRAMSLEAQRMKRNADTPDPLYPGLKRAHFLLTLMSLVPMLCILIYSCILFRNALPMFFFVFMFAGTAVGSLQASEKSSPIIYIFPIMFMAIPLAAFMIEFYLSLYDYAFLLWIALVWWVAAFVLMHFLRRRSDEAQKELGKILGFKRFLLTAELSRIQALFDENPEYFSNIIPYCLIMGISKKVEKRFMALNIPAPQWAHGIPIHSFSSISRSLSRSSGGGGGGGGGGHGGSSGGGGGGGGSRGC